MERRLDLYYCAEDACDIYAALIAWRLVFVPKPKPSRALSGLMAMVGALGMR